jgi:hypothetical protein
MNWYMYSFPFSPSRIKRTHQSEKPFHPSPNYLLSQSDSFSINCSNLRSVVLFAAFQLQLISWYPRTHTTFLVALPTVWRTSGDKENIWISSGLLFLTHLFYMTKYVVLRFHKINARLQLAKNSQILPT